MQMTNSIYNARYIKNSRIIAKSTILCESGKQLTTLYVFKQHVYMFKILESRFSKIKRNFTKTQYLDVKLQQGLTFLTTNVQFDSVR